MQIDFTLRQLIEHFTIQDGQDVATLNPELHQRNLALLHEIEKIIAMSQTESFQPRREALVLRLRDQEKLTFRQIGDRFDRCASRAAQIYQAARHKIQFPTNGLSNRLNHLLAKAGFTVEKQAIASALRAGKLYPHCYPPTYGRFAHRDLCEWAGVDPTTLAGSNSYFETYRANGLSYRANHILKYAGIIATKAAVLESLKNGSLTPTKRPIGYGKITHAELCRWVGVTPHLFRNRKKVASQ